MPRLIITTILFSISTLLFSQKEINNKISLEPVIGIGISSMYFNGAVIDRFDSYYRKLNVHKEFFAYAGAYFKKPLSAKSHLKLGLTIGLEKLSYDISIVSLKPTTIINDLSTIEREIELFRFSVPIFYESYIKESAWFFSTGINANLVGRNHLNSTITYHDSGETTSVQNDKFTRLKKNASLLLGIGRKININNSNSALLVSLKSNYFLGSDDFRFFNFGGNNFIFNLELAYDF